MPSSFPHHVFRGNHICQISPPKAINQLVDGACHYHLSSVLSGAICFFLLAKRICFSTSPRQARASKPRPSPRAERQFASLHLIMATTTTSPLISTFQKHIEDMRNLVLCKICIKPLYEPYIIACGHTFCYSCLTSWFGGSGASKKRVKKCPDCRATVKVLPAPNYAVSIKESTLKCSYQVGPGSTSQMLTWSHLASRPRSHVHHPRRASTGR